MHDDLVSFIVKWNADFPIDRWWRKKHNIPFNSKKHQEQCFIDMRIEYEEDRLYKEIWNKEEFEPYEAGRGLVLERSKVDNFEFDSKLDDVDIDDLIPNENGEIII